MPILFLTTVLRLFQALKGEFELLVDVLVNNSNDVVMPVLERRGAATHADVRQWLESGW